MTRPVKILLTLSIAFNILLSGMMLGDFSHFCIAPETFDMNAALSRLPQDKRTLFDTVMTPAKKHMDEQHAVIDTQKKQALAILKAPRFDGTAYMSQIARIDALHDRMKEDMAQTIASLAGQLSLSDRDMLAEIISHPPFSLPVRPAFHTLKPDTQ